MFMDSQKNITAPALFFPSLLSRSSLRLELGQHLTSPEPSCFCPRPQPWGHRHLCITLARTLGGCWRLKLRFSASSDSPLHPSSRTLNCMEPVLTANETWHFRDALSVVTPVFPFPEWTPGPLVPLSRIPNASVPIPASLGINSLDHEVKAYL